MSAAIARRGAADRDRLERRRGSEPVVLGQRRSRSPRREVGEDARAVAPWQRPIPRRVTRLTAPIASGAVARRTPRPPPASPPRSGTRASPASRAGRRGAALRTAVQPALEAQAPRARAPRRPLVRRARAPHAEAPGRRRARRGGRPHRASACAARPAAVADHPDPVERGAAALVDDRRELAEPPSNRCASPSVRASSFDGRKPYPTQIGVDLERALASGYGRARLRRCGRPPPARPPRLPSARTTACPVAAAPSRGAARAVTRALRP